MLLPRPPEWVPPALRAAMIAVLLALVLTHEMPARAAFAALVPFFMLGLLTRPAAAAYVVANVVVGTLGEPMTWLGLPLAAGLLIWGAGRWALDPLGPLVLWGRGGYVMGDHPWPRAFRRELDEAWEEQHGKR